MIETVRGVVALAMLGAQVGATDGPLAVRDRIRAEYEAAHARIVELAQAHDRRVAGATWVGGCGTPTPEAAEILEPALAAMAEWAQLYVGQHAGASGGDVAHALEKLNPSASRALRDDEGSGDQPDDFFDELERYDISAVAVLLAAGGVRAFAVAVTYGYFGELFLVPEHGRPFRAHIARGGRFGSLPPSRSGHDRFFVNARSDDWPTSCCRGGHLTVYEWDGVELARPIERFYGDSRCDERNTWGIHVRGQWMKLYSKGLRTMSESCTGGALRALRKIRVGPDRVEEFEPVWVNWPLAVADEIFLRTLRHDDSSEVAAPEARRRTAALLERVDRMKDAPDYLGMLLRWRAWRRGDTVVLAITLDKLKAILEIAQRDGRPYVTRVRGKVHPRGRPRARC